MILCFHRDSNYAVTSTYQLRRDEMFGKFDDSAFGTMWKKLVRKEGTITSIEAAEAVDTTKLERIVYQVIASHPDGCIQDEVLADLPDLAYSSVTARFSALLRKGYIKDTGETRKGRSGRNQRVLKAINQEKLCLN